MPSPELRPPPSPRGVAGPSSSRPRERTTSKEPKEAAAHALQDYQLGDLLGKGASGSVYRALNFTNGETVAVKQIQLASIPKAELGEIMSEINLLKNLNHPNIVKYKGYVKSKEFLHIILEYCENGSLHSICKRFGKFPEHLVGQFIYQTLQGLSYLHEQGVIHRDIKGANILTIKDGRVKLADFGVATINVNLGVGGLEGARDLSVVGSPYWMAPEIIEQAGASTASDIWSVGCVVIELLSGKPPYYALEPMQAMFRIVQDEMPPLPPGVSEAVKDFLLSTFQKSPELRLSARRLMKHPWMLGALKQLESRRLDYQEGVERVQKFNKELEKTSYAPLARSSNAIDQPRARPSSAYVPGSNFPALHPSGPAGAHAVVAPSSSSADLAPKTVPASYAAAVASPRLSTQARDLQGMQEDAGEEEDNWDGDFEEGITLSKLAPKAPPPEDVQPGSDPVEPHHPEVDAVDHWNSQTIMPSRSSSGQSFAALATPTSSLGAPQGDDNWSDMSAADGDAFQRKVAQLRSAGAKGGVFHPDDIKDHGIPFGAATVTVLHPPPSTTSPAAPPPPASPPITSPKFSSLRLSRSRSDSPTNFLDGLRSPSVTGGQRRASDRGSLKEAMFERDLQKYAEGAEDYEDIFDRPAAGSKAALDMSSLNSLKLNTRLSDRSWLGEDADEEEDPFAAIDESFGQDGLDSETDLIRDKHARLTAVLGEFIDELQPNVPDFTLRNVCDQVLNIISDVPEMQAQFVVHHGMLAILEVLEAKPSREVILRLLRIINLIVISDISLLESFCLIGGIPVVISFTLKQFTPECRLEAAIFISALCNASVQTLQMFISCRGLRVLVELLDEDYKRDKELVIAALGGIGSVFQLQSATPRNDFCRMFVREGLEDPLSTALLNITQDRDDGAEEAKAQILAVFLLFCQISQSDKRVRDALGKRRIMKRVVSACGGLQPAHLITLLRSIKHLSTSTSILDVLQNVNAIEILAEILGAYKSGPHSTEICNNVLQTLFNLCRLNKSRQEEAAQSDIIPHLKELVKSRSPLRQFALPILFDFASASKGSRSILWKNDGLRLYLELTGDPYWQSSALDSILVWLQEETARVEDVLVEDWSADRLVSCFVDAKAVSFESLLDRFLRILRLSPAVAVTISRPAFFRRLVARLDKTAKPVVRLNLLKITRVVAEAHPDRASYLTRFGILEVVDRLARQDSAVLVRELAKELAKEIDFTPARPVTPAGRARGPSAASSAGRPKSSSSRRAASESSTKSDSSTRAAGAPTSTRPAPPPVPPVPRHILQPRRPLQPAATGGQPSPRPPTPTHRRKTSRALADIRWVEDSDGQIKPTSAATPRQPS